MRRVLCIIFYLCVCATSGCDDGTDSHSMPDAGEPRSPSQLERVGGELLPIVLSVWQAPDGKAWFCGGARGEFGGFIARFESGGIQYEAVEYGRTVWWIWGRGEHAHFASGEGGRVLARSDDGWRVAYRHGDPRVVLWGGWTGESGETWVVGGSHGLRGPKGVILRHDTTGGWRRFDTETLGITGNLFKVWGRHENDVFFVGENGVALHWDGTELRRMETGTEDLLFTVHGTVDGPVYAVGGAANARILRVDGTAFVDDGAPAGQPPLNGVYARPDGVVFAVGARGTVLVRSLDGAWTRRRDESLRGLDNYTLHAVSGTPVTWAVGGDFAAGIDGILLTDLRIPVVSRLGSENILLEGPDVGPDIGVLDSGPLDHGPGPDSETQDASTDIGADTSLRDMGLDGSPRADGAQADSERPLEDMSIPLDQRVPACGDGILDPEEACDDGNLVDGDGCSNDCHLECGDGAVTGTETCDDGNRLAGDGCDAECQLECGNHVLDGDEQCDDGALLAGDGCDPDCRFECGNGIIDPGEQCDDEGREPGDGCSSECEIEPAGPGQGCEERECAVGLECLGVAIDDFFPVCTVLCNAIEDCWAAGFVEPTRCDLIGPQLIDTYCVPERCYDGGCE